MKLANALVEADSTVNELEDPEASAHGGAGGGGNKGIYSPAMLAHTRAAFQAAPRFLLLDFRYAGNAQTTQRLYICWHRCQWGTMSGKEDVSHA